MASYDKQRVVSSHLFIFLVIIILTHWFLFYPVGYFTPIINCYLINLDLASETFFKLAPASFGHVSIILGALLYFLVQKGIQGSSCISLSQPALHPFCKDVITPLRKNRWEASLPWTGVSCKLQWWFGKKPHQWEHVGCSNPSQKAWGAMATPGPTQPSWVQHLLFLRPPWCHWPHFASPPTFTDIAQKRQDSGSEWNVPLCYGTKCCQALTLILKNHCSTIYTCWYDGAISVLAVTAKIPHGSWPLSETVSRVQQFKPQLFHQEARTLKL